MSRYVPHRRPEHSGASVRSKLPVGAFDWATLGALANFCNGHGSVLIPHCAVGHTVTASGSATFHFYIAPSKRAVERIWVISLRTASAGDVTADVTVNGAGPTTVPVRDSRNGNVSPHVILESLSAKTSTAGGTTVVVDANVGNVIVESIACYEQTRGTLDANTDDYGVDLTTLRVRNPIADFSYESVGGVFDALSNLDCRRAGFFHLAAETSVAPTITNSSAPGDALTQLPVTVIGTLDNYGATTSNVTVATYAQVDSGTGYVRFASTEGGDTIDVPVTATSYAWVTDSLAVGCEDTSTSDGLRAAWTLWEDVTITAYVDTATNIDVAAIAIVRTTTPI